MKLVNTSYPTNEVSVLLKDITGLVKPLNTEEREMLIQGGVHYSEMLPLEYKPTEDYMQIYERVLKDNAYKTALAVCELGKKLFAQKKEDIVLISLARAGTPIGILLKRFIKDYYNVTVPHFSISIIRGKGLDYNALDYILKKCYEGSSFQFVDGWIGKGAIQKELADSLKEYKCFIDPNLAVLSDPAFVVPNDYCGTREDFIIPSSCLNATVSGLFSRTFRRPDIIGEKDFDGAIYYGDLESEDKSMEFIETIYAEMEDIIKNWKEADNGLATVGIDVVKRVAQDYGIKDINKVKPGIGETTRVLLRRVPDKVLISEKYKGNTECKDLAGIFQLCEEKGVSWEYYDTGNYKAIGIIKDVSDL